MSDSQPYQGEHQFGRHDVEHVCPDLVSLLAPLQPDSAHWTARTYAEPRFEHRPAAAVGTAESERSPEQDGCRFQDVGTLEYKELFWSGGDRLVELLARPSFAAVGQESDRPFAPANH